MIGDIKKLRKKRIYPQDIEYIEYHLRNEADVGDDYCIVGNPAFIKLKGEKIKVEYQHISKNYCCMYKNGLWRIYDPNNKFIVAVEDARSAKCIVDELNSLLVNESLSDNKILLEAVSYRSDGKFIENETDTELSAKEVIKVIKDGWDNMPAGYYSWKLKEVEK